MSRKRVKQYLMLLTAVGLLSISAGGSGTFASFNAEVANNGNTFAAGTLYLHDLVGGGQTCTSESDSLNQNVPVTVGGTNPGDQCTVLFNLGAGTDWSTPKTVDLTLTNAGTLDASDLKFQLNGSGCIYTDTGTTGLTVNNLTLTHNTTNADLSADIANGATVTTIQTAALTRVVYAGSTLELNDGTNTQTFTVAADAAVGDTSISVNSASANFAFSATSPVTHVQTTDPITSLPVSGTTTVALQNGNAIQLRAGNTASILTAAHYQTFTNNTVGTVGFGTTPSSITIPSTVPNFAYTNSTNVYAAFGPNNACDNIPYTITETNSAFDGPDESTHTGVAYGINGGTTADTSGFEGCAYGTVGTGGCTFDQADNIGGIPTRNASLFNTLTLSSGGGTGSHSGVNSGTGLDANGGARYFIITVFPQFGDPVMGETAVFDMNWHMDQA